MNLDYREVENMDQPKLRFPQYINEWKKCTLASLIIDKPKNGFSPEPVNYKTDFPVLSISAVTTGTFRGEHCKYTDCNIDKDAQCWVKNEDILIQRSNTAEFVGVSAIYEGEDNKYIYPDLLMKIHAKNGINSKFLSCYLITPNIRQYYKKNACGTSGNMPKINQKTVLNTPLYITEVGEQNRIAELMSRIDKRIENQRLIIEDWEAKKRGIIQKLFKQEVKFKQENGNTYPQWKDVKLSELLSERKTKAIKDGSYEHVSLTKEGVVPKTAQYNRDFLVMSDDKEYKITKMNDICYNPANLKFGVICRNTYGEGIFSPIYITFEVTEKNVPEFVEIMVTRADFINYALRYQEGTVYERMAVSPEDLLGIEVKIPCEEEQRKIAKCISVLNKKIEIEKKILSDWNDIKKALLQQMFV